MRYCFDPPTSTLRCDFTPVFACSYFEYEGMNGFMPDWKIFKDFNSNDRTGALAYDSSLGSHALSNFQPGPWSPGEIGSMFDSISYAALPFSISMFS